MFSRFVSLAATRLASIRALPVRLARGLLVACLALICGAAFAQATGARDSTFDHATTGFALSGQHATARCESCHLQGVFRGTPRECSTCHRNGSRPTATQFPLKHIPTTQQCDVCHRTAAWNVVVFRHQGVTKGSCLTCHNGVQATGKPAQHLVTTASCDTCHNTLVWTATTWNHAGVVPGTCANCHNGVQATGKRASHIPTTASCDTCHTTTTWTAKFDHSSVVAGTCNTCHNGVTTTGKGRAHIPTTASCDVCHKNYVAFTPATMDHAGMTGQCSTCHSGSYLSQNAQSKPSTHVATTAQCDTCHKSTTSWATATFNHAAASPTVTVGDHSCANCHKAGGPGLSMPNTHIPTSVACDICHTNFTAFRPAAMSHDGTAGKCSTCHNGSYNSVGTVGAQAKPVTHLATTSQCDVCHTTAAWKPATYSHDATSANRCSACHNGVIALGKSATHIPDNRQCDVCHTSTTTFLSRTMNHTGLTGQCSTCHSGAYVSENAQTKSASHTATTAQCDTCHNSTLTWATATIDHSKFSPAVTMGDHTCATCHKQGGTGLPMPNTHIPTTAACDTCHTTFAAFRPATMNHTGTAGTCSTCHSGAYVSVGTTGAQAKPTTHVATTAQCDSCHASTAKWLPASYPHDATTVGKCSTCHDGKTATGKGATHIPDLRQCDTCHTNTTSFLVATMNHTGLANQCSTCHSGSYTSENAQAKSAAHVSTTAQCDSCHKSTTTWATATADHSKFSPAVTIGNHTCANCHKSGGSGLPMPTNHIPMTGISAANAYCDNCHTNFTAFAPATMSHTGSTGLCANCHNGSYTAVNAQAKPANHIATTASCDACHATTAWKPAANHTAASVGQCATCHNGTTATGKISGHIPTTASCDVCHRTSAWMPLITPYAHSGIAAGSCTTCHASGFKDIDVKPSNHIPTSLTSAASCDACHTMSTWTTLKATYSHTGTAGQCTTCHTTPYTGITVITANHIPTTAVSATWASCDACHSTSTFAGVKLHNTTRNTTVAGKCQLCHEYGNPYGLTGRKPSDHKTAARMAPNSCDNSGCHSVRGF